MFEKTKRRMITKLSPVTALTWRAVVALVILTGQTVEICPNDPPGSCKQPGTLYQEPDITDTVSYNQLKQMLATGNVQLFDVREPDEYEEGHILGATNVPLGEVEQAFLLNPNQFLQYYGVHLPQKTDSDFILYCQRGRRSLFALEIVQHLGYTRARHYAGGYGQWEQLENL